MISEAVATLCHYVSFQGIKLNFSGSKFDENFSLLVLFVLLGDALPDMET